MSLAAGTRLGSYEVLGPLGAGGMGEVYRARDTELKREVALKVLPAAFATDTDRVSRFQREAELLATLNHPHIAAIYGLHRDITTTALALELVEGDTLADRIARGRIGSGDARRIARQIVSALEAAHERGIVHRDLKPANIKIRPDGTVKVLDFGLAKALAPGPDRLDPSLSPTITTPPMTHAGVILGTAAYMSPEQARGQTADERSDIWAFGCVLFEMLAGEKAFHGDTVAEALASVLKSDPAWARLPADTPAAVRRLLRRCLQKDPARRLADIRDARLELEESDEGAPAVRAAAPPSRTFERLLWSAALIALTIAVVALAVNRPRPPAPPQDHTFLAIPPTTDPPSFALAPDGRQVVFVASVDGRPQLWHYSFDTGQRRVLTGTADAAYPFWSPDSRSIGFFTNERLYRMEIAGGAPREVSRASVGAGGTWNRDNVILFTPVPDALVLRAALEPGPFIPVPGSGAAGNAPGERFPAFLPDGRHFLYYKLELRQVFVAAIDEPDRSVLIDGADSAAVVAPPDQVLFVRRGDLMMQRFDPTTLRLVGQSRSLGSNVGVDARGSPAVSASANGDILFRTGSGYQQRRLTLVGRNGEKIRDLSAPDPSFPVNPDLCPGERKVVLNRSVNGNTGIDEIELDRGIPTTLTTDAFPEIVPICSPRGVTYAMLGPRAHVARLLPGASAPVSISAVSGVVGIPLDEHNDGTVLYRGLGEKTGWDIYAAAPNGVSRPLLANAWEERSAQFSPDGRWLVYESNESAGAFEILLQAYPLRGVKKNVSRGGGWQPRWEGDEIFYVSADGDLTVVRAVPSADGSDINLSLPTKLFRVQIETTVQGGIGHAYAVFPGAKQFLLSTFTELPAAALTLIRNVPRR